MTKSSKPLIVAEKPSAARAIAEALGGFSSRNGYMESRQYVLTWAIGHLVEQMAPEEYDPRWKRWSLDTLPMLPAVFGVKVVPKTRSQFETVARLARSAPLLINACDAGREGELIFRYICQAAAVDLPVKRLWMSSLTKEAIRKAFADLHPQSEYDRLYQSALCRAQGDWLIGMNATRAFTVKWGELLSVGRVQTPTLALIVRREREIESFVPESYWEVWAAFATPDNRAYKGKWFGSDGDRLKEAAAAQAIAARTLAQPGVIDSVKEKPVSERPPQLYDLTSLQREANRRFGLTAAATLKAAQALYEEKLITYPRTDSRYLSRDLLPELPAIVQAVGSQPEFQPLAQGADLRLVHAGNRRVVDDGKITDHHAIIPTTEHARGLTGLHAKIYGLIVRRFLAQFYPEARYLDVEVVTRVGHLPDYFRSRGRQVLELGWRIVDQEAAAKRPETREDEEETAPLPSLQQGEGVLTRSAEAKERITQPPRRFSEAALLSAMELAGRDIQEEAVREAMKARGLGTPATRAAIIERLKEVGYVTLEKKTLLPTGKGRRLVELAEAVGAQVLLSADLTGEWEKRIADIQAGCYDPNQFMKEIRGLASQVVEWVKKAEGEASATCSTGGSATDGPAAGEKPVSQLAAKCPRCGSPVTRSSKGWSCTNGGCNVRVPSYLCGKVIDAALAEALLVKGRTPLITEFISPRTGKVFSAYLVLRSEKVEFEFPPAKSRRGTGRKRTGNAGSNLKVPAGNKGASRTIGNGKASRTAGKTGVAPGGRGITRPRRGTGGSSVSGSPR